jgi:dolichol-phosphate mannosyltransferase
VQYDLSIIIPCLNEQDNIIPCLEKVDALIKKNELKAEVIIIDDKSEDNTLDRCRRWILENQLFNYTILQRELDRRGYGAVVRYGILHSKSKYCTFVSADMVDPIQLLPKMLKIAKSGIDIVQCSRYIDVKNSESIPYKYKFFQFFYRHCVFWALGLKIADSTYAFKLFDRFKIMSLGTTQNRFSISPEILFKSILANNKIAYIPGAQTIRNNGVSKFNFKKESIGFIYCLIRAYLHRKKYIYWF